MMSTSVKLITSIFVLSLTACATQAPLTSLNSSAENAVTPVSLVAGNDSSADELHIDLEPKKEEKQSILGRVVKTVAGVAAPALGVYRVANGMVADTVVLAAVETVAAKLAVEDKVAQVATQADLENLNQLVLIKDKAVDQAEAQVAALDSQAEELDEQVKGLDAVQLISQVDAQYNGAANIQSAICSNASPQQLARLQAVSSDAASDGWIDLGMDVQLPSGNGNAPVTHSLVVHESNFGSLCTQTADKQSPQNLRRKQEIS